MHTECRSTENRELSTLELDVVVGGNSKETVMTPAQRTAKAGEDYRHGGDPHSLPVVTFVAALGVRAIDQQATHARVADACL
jgi:hypothetical protein